MDNCQQSNFPPVATNVLDIPISGTNITLRHQHLDHHHRGHESLSAENDPGGLHVAFRSKGFTNTVATLRAPDQ